MSRVMEQVGIFEDSLLFVLHVLQVAYFLGLRSCLLARLELTVLKNDSAWTGSSSFILSNQFYQRILQRDIGRG